MAELRPPSCEYNLNMSPRPLFAAAACLALLLAALIPGCSRSQPQGPRVVLVEVAPLVTLVTPLVGPGVDVRPIVPAGVSPHGYQLTPSDAAALATADLVITVGPMLEPAIARAIEKQTPRDRVFDMAAALEIDAGDHHDHDHDHADHDHAHAVDPHLWLDPKLMLTFVTALDADLAQRGLARPDHASYLTTLTAAITSVDTTYEQRLTPFAGRSIITHHDAFRRIADRYGISIAQVLRPVSSVEPTPGDLTRAAEAVRASGAKAIFVEPQFSDALPRRLADELGLELVRLDPVGSEDWFTLMYSNLDYLVRGLSLQGPGAEPPPSGDDAGVAEEPSDG